MESYKFRPSSNFIESASWEELHVLTEKWKSDLEFYNFELSFLHKLIDKYYIWLSNDELVNEVEDAARKIFTADKIRKGLALNTIKHLRHIEEIIENEFSNDAQLFRREHEELENSFASFCKKFQLLKKEVFMLTEQVLDTENVSGYL